MCPIFVVPPPFYQIGQRIETRWVADDTRELSIDHGVIYAMTWTNNSRDKRFDLGWNYHIAFDSPRQFEDEVHESEIIPIEED